MSESKSNPVTIDKGASLSNVDLSTKNTNTTVVYQGGAAAEKRKEEDKAFFRDFARRHVNRGIVTDDIRRILDEKAFELGLSNVERDLIIEQVRSYVPKASAMSEIQRKKFEEARTCIYRNSDLDSATRTLKALSEKCSDEEVDFFFNMAMAARYPMDHINQYVNRKTDSYWQTYWGYLSYVRMKRYKEAEELILELDNFDRYPTVNVMPLLKNAGLLIRTNDTKALKAALEEEGCEGISQELVMMSSTLSFVAQNGLVFADKTTYANFYLENFFNVKRSTMAPVLRPEKPVGVTLSNEPVETEVTKKIEKAVENAVAKVVNRQTSTPVADPAPQPRIQPKVPASVVAKADKNAGNTGNFGKRTITAIAIGAACVLAVLYLLNTPKESAQTKLEPVRTVTETPAAKPAAGIESPKPKSSVKQTVATAVEEPKKPTVNSAAKPVKAEPAAPKPKSPSELTPAESLGKGQSLLAEGRSADAASYIRSAADRGSAPASYEMAQLYKNGSGVQKNTASAFAYMKAAAEAGYTKAFRELGEMYHGGRGTTKDRTSAEFWYRKAVEAGDMKAQRILNNM